MPSASKIQIWTAKLWAMVESELWLAKFMGEGVNNVIQVSTELSKKRGDTINFFLQGQIDAEPVVGDAWLEGREAGIKIYPDKVTIDRARQAVIPEGVMDLKGSPFNFQTIARDALARWLRQWIETSWFRVLSGDTSFTFATNGTAATTNRHLWGGDAVSKATIDSADWLGTYEISRMKTLAKKANPKIAPLIVDGMEKYILFIGENQHFYLKQNDTDYVSAMEEAYRGTKSKHPLITGATVDWDGVLIHVTDKVMKWTDAGASTPPVLVMERAVFCGAQAGLMAIGGQDEWNQSSFDYGDKVGHALGKNLGYKKAKFTGQDEDHAVMIMDTYAPEPVGVAHT